MRPSRKLAVRQKRILLAIALPLVLAGSTLLLLKLDALGGDTDFRNNLWGPAHLLLHGQSPYLVEVLYEGKLALWLPQAIGLFSPLGWLELRLAANIWFLGNVLLVFALLWWTHRAESAPLPPLTVVLVLLLPPVLIHFNLGQFSLLATLLLLAATRLVVQQRFVLAGLLVALVLAKPQLALLVVPGLWLASLRLGGRRGALAFPLAVLLGSGLLTLPLWIGYPNWVPDFLGGFQKNPPWDQPTLFTVFRFSWGQAGWVLPGLIALGLLSLNMWLWWRYPAEEALPWSLALTTIASPYIWTWDFVLFLPLILRCLARQRGRPARILWSVGLCLCWILTLWVRLLADKSYHWHFWMPWWLFMLVLGSHWVEARRAGAERPPLLWQENV